MNRRAFTLIELIISMFLVVLIAGSVFALFIQSRQNYERPRASMAAQESLTKVVRWLRQDLSETNVQTIRSFPNTMFGGSSEPPGMSLESPRHLLSSATTPGEVAEAGAQNGVAPLGSVQWQKYVYYTVQPDPAQPKLGDLIRYEGPLSDQPDPPAGSTLIPVASAHDPSTVPADHQTAGFRVLAQDVVLGTQQAGGASTITGMSAAVGLQGGFQVFFVPPQGGAVGAAPLPLSPTSLLSIPPASGAMLPFDDNNPSHNFTVVGVPVVVNLAIEDFGPSTGKPTVNTFQLQITPQD